MQKALEEAEKSLSKNEVPVGAVIILDGEIIGKGHKARLKLLNAIFYI